MILDLNIDKIRYQILDKFMHDECNLYQEVWFPMNKYFHDKNLSDYSTELSSYIEKNKYTVDAFGVQVFSYVNEFKTLPLQYIAEKACDRSDKVLMVPLRGAEKTSKVRFYDIPTDAEDPYEAVDMHIIRNKLILEKNGLMSDNELITHLFDMDTMSKYTVEKRLMIPYWIKDRLPVEEFLIKDNVLLWDNKLSYTVDHYVKNPGFVTFGNIISFMVRISSNEK